MGIGERERAFTLVEMILTIVILSILGLFSFSFFSNLAGTYASVESQTEIYQQGNYAMERISRELRDAQPWVDSNGVIQMVKNDGSGYMIRLSHATPADAGSVYVRYRLSGGTLVRDSGVSSALGATAVLATNATAFTVSSATPGTTPIFTLEVQFGSGGQMQTFRTKVAPKNYSNKVDGCCYTNSLDSTATCFGGYGGCYEDVVF